MKDCYIYGLMKAQFFVFLAFLTLFAGCGKFHRIEKSEDWRIKYEAAMNYYDTKDYYRASVLFEQILPIVRGLLEGEPVQFRMAYCQYYNKYYILAAEQFKTFYETYGRSPYVEEARYMYAYSLYRSTPEYELDQSGSIQSMIAMQDFLNRYPKSSFDDEAVKVIEESQLKLELKGFVNAKQYYLLGDFSAAVIALGNFKNNFPDSKYIEEADYLIIQSQYKLAKGSVLSKQLERYTDVIISYKKYIDTYPNSTFLSDAEKMYVDSQEKINSLKKSNS